MNKTQKERVLEKLSRDGSISNFWAIENRILRLGAVIADLKNDGYYFRSDYIEGTKNYCYYMLKSHLGKNLNQVNSLI